MPVRIVEGQLPYTGGTGIEIDANKVISLLLREENNLIMVNDNNEVYTDLQLESGLNPSSDFPVGVTVGKVLQADGWTKSGLVLNRKTTSGDYARWIYATDGEIYFDNGTGTRKQVYYSSEVDSLFAQLRSELATVAFTGDYDDLINKPVDDTMYGSSWDGETEKAPSQNAVYDKINSIDSLISTNATSTNKLMDKNYIDDGINSVTAYYITKNAQGDQFATHAELASATTFYSGGVVRTPTRNDYTIVLDDETHNDEVTRYIYNNGWEYQYTINESPMTQAQLNALNSGITSAKVSQYDGYATSKANDSEVVKLSGNQTIAGTKTFSTSPVVPSKTTAATNSGTKIATEAQVYKKQDKLVSGTNIKTINSNSLLGSGNLTLNDVKVSSTAPSSPTEGMAWYDTTNDQLKVYDGTNWNVTGKEYNAGPGISIRTLQDYSAMRGPCPEGFHVPSEGERSIMANSLISTFGRDPVQDLKMPLTGYRKSTDGAVNNQGNQGDYRSVTYEDEVSSMYYLEIGNNSADVYTGTPTYGRAIRPLKDEYVSPDNTWNVIQGTLGSAGIFRNQSEGLISITDGSIGYTIADKNLGATQVYNYGDTLSETNCGKYYQRGNNYGFPRTGSVTTSSTLVDASTYGPGNYYSSSTFITDSVGWDSSNNTNLRGGVTGVVTIDNAITNTGVLSVNGETGDVTIDMSNYLAKDNTTAFTPSGNYNPATKKYVDDTVANTGVKKIDVGAVSDWTVGDDWTDVMSILDGGSAAILYDSANLETYYLTTQIDYSGNTVVLTVVTGEDVYKVTLDNNNEISAIERVPGLPSGGNSGQTLVLDSGNPLWRRPGAYSSGTAPTSPSTGTIRWDSTNNVIKMYDGTSWVSYYPLPNPIQVVASLPANPDANTIYIVQ